MKKLITCWLALLALTTFAFAQDRSEIKAKIKAEREALQSQRKLAGAPSGQAGAAITGVGEPDSFGKPALFLGVAQSGIVFLDPTCDPNNFPNGPDDHCIVTTPGMTVPLTTFNDIARITIPGKSVSNIVYAIANHNVTCDMFNTSGASALGQMTYIPSVTIESAALNDPSLIDPTTGNPFNGSFTTTGIGSFSTSKTLAAGASDFQTFSFSRANTQGFSRTFFAGLGLPSAVIDDLYKKPMTIKLNVRVTAKWVETGILTFSVRFLGN